MLDNVWPSPKELAHAINEVLPTDDHLRVLEDKIYNKARQKISTDSGIIDYVDKYREELIKEVFKEVK